MELKDQLSGLESSKRLKELGVKQESLFYYWNRSYYSIEPDILFNDYVPPDGSSDYRNCSAYTVAELGMLLPNYIEGKFLTIRKCSDHWSIGYMMHEGWIAEISHVMEAEAMAQMLIYLLEQKLMEVPK